MPKKKTNKAVSKRFKMTATGKVMRSRGGKSHLNAHKSRKRKRQLRGMTRVHKSMEKTLGMMLG